MNKENKVTSKPLSKKIHDKAKEKGFELPESEYYHLVVEDGYNTASKIVNFSRENRSGKYNDGTKWSEKFYKAHDIAELGEMLPRMIKIDDKKVGNKEDKVIGIFQLHFYKNDYEWLLQYKEWHGERGLIVTDAKTEAEARGLMYFYLLDNDLL